MSKLTPRERARDHARYALRPYTAAGWVYAKLEEAWLAGYRSAARARRKVIKSKE